MSSPSSEREKLLPDSFIKFCTELVNSAEERSNNIWKLEASKDGVSVYTKPVENASTGTTELAFRISGTIKSPLQHVFEATRQVHFKAREKNSVEEACILEQVNKEGESFDITYQRTSSPSTWLVYKREFLSARYFIEDSPDKKIIFEKTIDPKLLTSSAKMALSKVVGVNDPGCIYATIYFQIIEFQKINDETTQFDIISKMNMNGWIPMNLINSLIKIAPQKAREDMESCIKFYRESTKSK